MPTRSVGPNDQVVATITFDGVGDVGAFDGDTRNVTGFSVTNNTDPPVAVFVRVEEELNKQRVFEATILPGQTLEDTNIPNPKRPQQVWRTGQPFSFWDGLNVYWKVPA